MITSWVLFIVVSSGSRSMAVIPNLKDLQECQRIEKVINNKINLNFTTLCVETITK